ncbi:MAG: L-serine ammonia-lyase [Ruaniaceae bacterium]|nr:L-serine ammonia-lyase [Ruaniaceae bacterium]
MELFSIGIGPSSSHTVGPMRAGKRFADALESAALSPDRLRVRLHGSLAATGLGHGTPAAALAGLYGWDPVTCDPVAVPVLWERLADEGELNIRGMRLAYTDVVFEPRARHYGHPNALTFEAYDDDGTLVRAVTYLSIGGGFIQQAGGDEVPAGVAKEPSFSTAAGLLDLCHGTSIAEVAWSEELALGRSEDAVRAGLDAIWNAMNASIEEGIRQEGPLPGGLGAQRRAKTSWESVEGMHAFEGGAEQRLLVYAMAVNEQNAGGGRIVTAPTNGAAGVIPAVIRYAVDLGLGEDGIRGFLLTATAIGSLIKANASISGAEAGCQGEVGSACAMAAAGLTSVWGGTPQQVENAAEIAMEHHLGLTCDPVGGLVQIPCIERNAVAASTALTAARISLMGDGIHMVSLDVVIETMRQTGEDMSSRYKETAEGGLAVNVPYC